MQKDRKPGFLPSFRPLAQFLPLLASFLPLPVKTFPQSLRPISNAASSMKSLLIVPIRCGGQALLPPQQRTRVSPSPPFAGGQVFSPRCILASACVHGGSGAQPLRPPDCPEAPADSPTGRHSAVTRLGCPLPGCSLPDSRGAGPARSLLPAYLFCFDGRDSHLPPVPSSPPERPEAS